MCANLRAGHHSLISGVVAMFNRTISSDLKPHNPAPEREGWMKCVSGTLSTVVVCVNVWTSMYKDVLYKIYIGD